MSNLNIAYVTYLYKGIYDSTTVQSEDNQLLDFLKTKGLSIEKVIWNNPLVNWEDYNIALLKSPWDYFDHIEDFYHWLEQLKAKNIRLLNPVEVVKWNADKHYLLEIEAAGLKVTPSVFINKNQQVHLSRYLKQFKTDKLIVKPCVSGGSKNTFKVTVENLAEVTLKLAELIKNEAFIVQPFLNEILDAGEWSFIFFNGKFSHALLKKTKLGDFRVQHIYGGTIHPQVPPPRLLAQAQNYADLFAKDCLYARVDGVLSGQEFILMELELIEPFLFLNTNPLSYENYYAALQNMM